MLFLSKEYDETSRNILASAKTAASLARHDEHS